MAKCKASTPIKENAPISKTSVESFRHIADALTKAWFSELDVRMNWLSRLQPKPVNQLKMRANASCRRETAQKTRRKRSVWAKTNTKEHGPLQTRFRWNAAGWKEQREAVQSCQDAGGKSPSNQTRNGKVDSQNNSRGSNKHKLRGQEVDTEAQERDTGKNTNWNHDSECRAGDAGVFHSRHCVWAAARNRSFHHNLFLSFICLT